MDLRNKSLEELENEPPFALVRELTLRVHEFRGGCAHRNTRSGNYPETGQRVDYCIDCSAENEMLEIPLITEPNEFWPLLMDLIKANGSGVGLKLLGDSLYVASMMPSEIDFEELSEHPGVAVAFAWLKQTGMR